MADITSALAAVGVTICSCAAETDREKGIGVALFHIEADLESLVGASLKIDMILGVLGWSTGCSWSENKQFLEC
uniref:RelA-SpoT RSH1 n=2 Tax=Solanum tuberosum TaxID=4113 RepID=M1D4P3_SOLTU